MDGRSEGGRTSVSQSIGQQTDCQFAKQWASRGSRPAEGRWDAQGLVLARAHAQLLRCSCRPSGERVAGQGRAACPWRLGLLLAAGRCCRGPGAQLPFLVRHPATRLPQQTLTLELGAFDLDDYAPARLITWSSINLS